MHIVILGDPLNGFIFIGPFATELDAQAYIDADPSDNTAWSVALTGPEDALD